MRIAPEVFESVDEIGRSVATTIADGIAAAGKAGRRYLLGCPTGRSPEPVYRALADEVRARRLDLSHVVVVLMDDYLERGPDGTPHPVAEDLPHSCVGWARRRIVGPLALAAKEAGVSGDVTTWAADPADPAAYDARIRDAGGIDLFLLASGASDGHIAFNPPGSPRDSVTRVVELGEATRRDNLATFPEFPNLQAVPTLGVSVGISTIADLSTSVVMLVHGSDKVEAYHRLATALDYEPDWPATILTECRRPRLVADLTAAAPTLPAETSLSARH